MKKNKIIKIIVIFAMLMLAADSLISQYNFIPYYGKNKVMKRKFKWQVAETDHFKIHYYVPNQKLINRIAETAEKAYEKMSKLLNIKPEKKVPIIFYKSHIDFEQTNVYPGFLPPGVLAMADAFSKRVFIQGDLPGGDLMRTLTHELGHVFEYTILGRAAMFRPPPLWVMEGFSEYITGHWDSFDQLVVRDSVIYDLIPEIMPNGQLKYPVRQGRAAYNWGHFLYEFIEEKFGPRGIRQLLYSYRGSALGSRKKSFLRAYNYTPKLFNYEFRKYVRDRYKKFITRENPEDYSFTIGPDFPYTYSFSHQLSPSGELLAVLTANMKVGKIDIILISMKDGRIIKNITPGFTTKYDTISMQFDPAGGLSIAWDKKGEKIAFFARKAFANYFVMIDALTGKILKRVKLEDIQGPSSPVFHPDNKKLYFIGIDNSRHCLYLLDLTSYEVTKITPGRLTIKSFDFSPDGKKLILSVFHEKYHKLYLAPLENPEMAIQITDGEYNDIAPIFSIDGKSIYYSSDELESYNLCSIDLEKRMMYRYTDVRTGNFFPMEIPGEKNQLVFSSFFKSRFHLFKKDISDYLEKRQIEFVGLVRGEDKPEEEGVKPAKKSLTGELTEGQLDLLGAAGLKQKSPQTSFEYEVHKYKPFKNLHLNSYTPVSGAIGTDGSVMGYTVLTFSDLMNDHQMQFFAYSYFGYRSYNLSYVNMSNRLQYFGSLYYFTDALWINYNAYLQIRQRLGGSFGFYYPFNMFYRAELGLQLYYQEENYDKIMYGEDLPYAQFFNGPVTRVNLTLAGDTIKFIYNLPNMGHTFRVSFEKYLKLGEKFLDAYNVMADFKKYFRINNHTSLAFRLSGYFSKGRNPQLFWFGGDNTLRASEFRRLVGNNAVFFNAELRFPLIYRSQTLIGMIGPIRGVFFFDLGGVWLDESPEQFRFFAEGRGLNNIFKPGSVKLKDAISSYGFGIALYMFGYPIHFDWVYQTDLYARKYYGVNFWIGFDF
ncbi:MAG: PD40 domain-containing protein [Candidatus Aminicenantes bacterium]|nr:PD40 domain-containing protein [Candidatus Aminicenantes bacterium]